MKKLNKIAIALAVSVTAGLAATAYAHQGEGRGMGHGAQGGQHQGMQGGMGHGQMQGMGHGMQGGMMGQGQMQGMSGRGEGCDGAMNQGTRPQAGRQLMTPEERTAMREKMRNAKTPEGAPADRPRQPRRNAEARDGKRHHAA